ncbi:hypothetical protein ACEQ8H_000244 [Pleosporales sp. CAS-2024a]
MSYHPRNLLRVVIDIEHSLQYPVMSDRHNAGSPSPPQQHHAALDTAPVTGIHVRDETTSSQSTVSHDLSFSMPDPARLRYSNRESSRVNAGLRCDHGDGYDYDEDVDLYEPAGPFRCNKIAVVNIDFSQLDGLVITPEREPCVQVLVGRLLDPPVHAFLYGVLSMQWVIGAVGPQHIQFRESDERYVLAQDSELRIKGRALGLPVLYMEWLCGDYQGISAAEQGIHLTRKYFDEINLENVS